MIFVELDIKKLTPGRGSIWGLGWRAENGREDLIKRSTKNTNKKLACRLYYEGVEPSDIIRSPKQYAELCKREIKRTIKRGLIS